MIVLPTPANIGFNWCGGTGSWLRIWYRIVATSLRETAFGRWSFRLQHHAKRKNICTAIHGICLDLLWRHVGGSACGRGLLRGAVLHDLRGAEIRNLHKSSPVNICWLLDIAMHDAVVMREL